MCGIVGFFGQHNRGPLPPESLQRAVEALRHRGPNAQVAETLADDVGLGHARLSVLDLRPESNQPFHRADSSYVMVYNGEIFNYVELRDELEGLGHEFRTTSDTEVLLAAYQQWGAQAVPRLNGMWAFAIYDRERDVLFCSRDRFGIKPFSYAVRDGRFMFASEVKALLELDPSLARPNFDALSLLLREGIGAQNVETCFDGVVRLPPAHNLTVSRGRLSIDRYWDFPAEQDADISPEDAAREVRATLEDALRIRMRSDVPVGSTLSSGLDSSALACLVRSCHRGEHTTFTAAFPGAKVDESPIARRLTESLGMEFNAIEPYTGELLPTLRRVIWHLESPHTSPAIFPLWNIMEVASKKVVVLLEGQGADEIFGGYLSSSFGVSLVSLAQQREFFRALRELGGYRRHHDMRHMLMLAVRHGTPEWVNGLFRTLRGDEAAYRGALERAVQRPQPRAQYDGTRDILTVFLQRLTEGNLVNLLHYGDAISMAHSVESRLPFLDYRLVELAFRLPGGLKIRDTWGKRVLRDAVSDIVPEEIAYARTKHGFTTPLARWFREKPQELVDPVLRTDRCRDRGLLDPTIVDRCIDDHVRGRRDMTSVLFRWICTEMWFQAFIDR